MADGTELSEIARRLVQANARLYKGWLDLSLEYVRGVSEILGGAPASAAESVAEADAGARALVMEGEAGSVVKGSFLVTNDMGKRVPCAFVGSDFRDARGAAVPAKATFSPTSLDLGPGEERVVQVAIAIDEALSPGVGYAGEISIRGMEGFSVPVVLRRLHRVEEGDERQEDAVAEPGRARKGRRTRAGRKG